MSTLTSTQVFIPMHVWEGQLSGERLVILTYINVQHILCFTKDDKIRSTVTLTDGHMFPVEETGAELIELLKGAMGR